MANALFNLLNPSKQMLPNTPANDVMNMVQSFNAFKNGFKGDPKAEVQKLLNSGAMSQQQYAQLQQMASMLSRYIK